MSVSLLFVFTCSFWKLLSYFFPQLLHCHALELLLGVAQVDGHLPTPYSRNDDLVQLAHSVRSPRFCCGR